MSVGRICTRTTYTATAEEVVRTAAARMADHGVGTLVVLDDDDRPIGMITDRDVTVRLVARGLDADDAPIGEIMSAAVHSVDETTPIESALGAMAGAGVRRSIRSLSRWINGGTASQAAST